MKRISNYKIMLIASIVIGASLCVGTTYAAFAVTDNAQPKSVKIGLGEIGSSTVRFLNYDGSVFKSEEVLDGETLSSLPGTPVYEGYTFDGWTTDNTSYVKTVDDFSTKTYNVDTTYYPRFASYGYAKGSGVATHLPNKWDINNNIALTQGDVIHVGTYINGKTSLENDGGVSTTIINSGEYAIVCDEHEGSWDSAKASNISNWFIEKYYTYTITDAMRINGYGLFGHFYNNDGSKTKTQIMTDNLISGNQYFVYGPNFATKVIFGALKSSSPRDMGTDWSNVIKQFDPITLNSTSDYNAPATTKVNDIYFRGTNNDWAANATTQLCESFDPNNIGEMLIVTLAANDEFKIASNDWSTEWGYWGYNKGSGDVWPSGGVLRGDSSYFSEGDGSGRKNIKCTTAGTYNFYLANDGLLYVSKV